VLTNLPAAEKTPVVPPGFDPCGDCAAPCAEACPGLALAAPRFDIVRCGQHRAIDPDCAESCAARRACVVGPEHAYPPVALAHHMRHARLP
jgi:epoxyqueuosine reductase QueG